MAVAAFAKASQDHCGFFFAASDAKVKGASSISAPPYRWRISQSQHEGLWSEQNTEQDPAVLLPGTANPSLPEQWHWYSALVLVQPPSAESDTEKLSQPHVERTDYSGRRVPWFVSSGMVHVVMERQRYRYLASGGRGRAWMGVNGFAACPCSLAGHLQAPPSGGRVGQSTGKAHGKGDVICRPFRARVWGRRIRGGGHWVECLTAAWLPPCSIQESQNSR